MPALRPRFAARAVAGLCAAALGGLLGCAASTSASGTSAISASTASGGPGSGSTTGALWASGSPAPAVSSGPRGGTAARPSPPAPSGSGPGSASGSGSGSVSGSGSGSATRAAARRPLPPAVALPPAAGRFDYQLGGAYDPPAGVSIVVRDAADPPARGSYGVCYLNAFQSQPDALAWWTTHHPGLLLRTGGGYVEDPDWPGEIVLDTSTPAKRAELAAIEGTWIDGCARRGFEAVEADNLDSWSRSAGLLSGADNAALARLLATRAHSRRLAIAQKNAPELAPSGRSIGFDFAIAEECQVYGECGAYVAAYGSRVLEVEYTDNGTGAFAAACRARAGRISILLRDRDLVPRGAPGYAYRAC